jgi:hypothetical protein
MPLILVVQLAFLTNPWQWTIREMILYARLVTHKHEEGQTYG